MGLKQRQNDLSDIIPAQSLDGWAEIFTLQAGLPHLYCELITKLHFIQFWASTTWFKYHLNPSASWCDPSDDPEAACEKSQGTGTLVELVCELVELVCETVSSRAFYS